MRRVLALLILVAAPLAAQTPETAATIPGLTVNTSVLLPLPTGTSQFPSGRFTLTKALGGLSLHGGALHLTPEGSGLWAAVGGIQLGLLDGPLQAAPFLEAGYGRVVQRVPIGGVTVQGGEVLRYGEETAGAPGAGAGLLLEWRIRPFLSLSGTAGYWYFASGNQLEPVDGPFFGAGLRFGLPFGGSVAQTPSVYTGPIQIRIEEPSAWAGGSTRGIRAVAKNSIRVVGTARDPSGVAIREVRLNGQLAALRPMDTGGSLARFVGFVPVTEETDGVEVIAFSADGRQATSLYDVTPTIPRVSDLGAQAAVARGVEGVTGRRFAVVIGVSDYVDEAIPDLDYADDDARAFYDFLRSERAGMGGIPDENITLLLNDDATYRNMRSALYTFLEQATDDDLVYIYIAAHGAPNPNRPDDLFILPYDAESEDIAGTGFPMEHVNEAIQKLYARHTVLLTDACHSGGIGGGGYATRAAPGDETLNAINRAFLQDLQATQSGLAILTASEARQLSREGEEWGGGHGVFTWFLLQGLEGHADTDGDQIVRLGELLEYVRDSVRRETNNGQIPAFGSNAFDRFMPMAVVPPDEN
jgi:hypothetical protein